MQPESSPKDIATATSQQPVQLAEQTTLNQPHIASDPRPPIIALHHRPRHHKRVMMLITLAVIVILLAIAVGYYLGTTAPKHT